MSPLALLGRFHGFNKNLGERRRRLFRVAYSWCQDTTLADDLVQETMTKAWKNIKGLRKPQSLDSWLFNILANCWRDHLRRQRTLEDVNDEAILAEIATENEMERVEMIERVRVAVSELPVPHREVIALIDLEGFSYAEVSQILDIPPGTVTSRVTRARETLRRKLQDVRNPDRDRQVVALRRVK